MLAPRCPKVLEVFAVCVFPSRLWNASASLGVSFPPPSAQDFLYENKCGCVFLKSGWRTNGQIPGRLGLAYIQLCIK